AHAEEIDVVILDVASPQELESSSVCDWMQRQLPGIREIPVVVLSPKSSPDEMARSFASGAFQHITKPCANPYLLAVVDSMARLKRIQDEARVTAEKYAAIFENAPLAMLVVNRNYEVLEMSRMLREFCPEAVPGSGIKAHEILYSPPRTEPHPDSPLVAALEQGAISRKTLELEQAGGTVWWNMSAAPLRDKQARIVGAVLIVEDVTRQRLMESRLREEMEHARQAEEQFRTLFEGMDDAVHVCDLQGRLLLVNPAACRQLDFTQEEMLAKRVTDFETPECARAFPERVRKLLSDSRCVYELTFQAKGGRSFPVDVHSSVIEFKGQKALLGIIRDITARNQAEEKLRKSEEHQRMAVQRHKEALIRQDEIAASLMHIQRELRQKQVELEEANTKLSRLAITDELTELYNRRHFDTTFTLEMRRALRYKHTLTLIMMDIDRFKRVNDTHGHPAGDAVLRRLGVMLKEFLRETDIIARYGGEEFVMVLPETPADLGLRIAERIRKGIEEEVFSCGPEAGIRVKITVSLGVATRIAETVPQALIARADNALYAAKEAGRNCVVQSETP
ncbi:MAG: diguanylate cyclase, partial [Planctomycetota bacterium]